jgi:hypothetical protein
MTPLRQRLLEDMQIRNLSVNTQRSYVEQVSRFARYFSQSPEVLGPEEIRAYHLQALRIVIALWPRQLAGKGACSWLT